MIYNIFANQMSKVRITEHSIGEGSEKRIYSTFQHLEIFFFFWLSHMACRILVPQPRAVKCLTTRPPGNSPFSNTTGGKANKLVFQKNSYGHQKPLKCI